MNAIEFALLARARAKLIGSKVFVRSSGVRLVENFSLNAVSRLLSKKGLPSREILSAKGLFDSELVRH